MPAFTSLALAVGLGVSAAGAYTSYQGQQTAKQGAQQAQQGAMIQAEAARQQAEISKEQAGSSVQFAGKERDINILASQQSIDASNKSFDINKGIIAGQQDIEVQKQKAMELDARRQQLEVIRNQQRGRALSLTTGVAQGGSGFVGGSSARGGAQGQISGQTGVNLLGIQQNLQIGRDIFGLNEGISNNRIAQADLQHTYELQQAANQTTKANTAYDYAVVNAGYQTRLADTQTLMSQGSGQVAAGQGQMQLGQMQSSFGSQLMAAGPQIFSAGTNFNQLSGSSFWGSANSYSSNYNNVGFTGSPFMKLFS